MAWAYESATELAKLGGDFYDAFVISPGLVGLLIGDVSGKGLDAAADAVLTRNTLRASTYYTANPAAALERTNRLLLDPLSGSVTY